MSWFESEWTTERSWAPPGRIRIPDGPDIPTTFDAMWNDDRWSPVFESWAGDQEGWTGPLTQAVFAMAEWGKSIAPSDSNLQWIVGQLAQAAPPLDFDASAIEALEDRLGAVDLGADPNTVFADVFDDAYTIVSQDQFTYAAFYNDVATYKARIVRKLAGPLTQENSDLGDPGDQVTLYKPMRNIWIQTSTGPQILKSSAGEEDVWYEPPEDQLARIAKQNGENVKDLADGETTDVLQLGDLVLIGDGHDQRDTFIAETYGVWGTVKVKKGSTFDHGSLAFTGMYDHDAVRRQIERFSEKKCKFA